jgi:hypothetical protein
MAHTTASGGSKSVFGFSLTFINNFRHTACRSSSKIFKPNKKMKRTLLSACIAMTSFAAFAQPTLTAASNAPVAGDKFVAHNFDTTGITWGASGASATWNFGSVTTASTDTNTFMSCASTPYCDSFAGANLASFDGGDYTYIITSASAITAIGGHSDTNYIHFVDPKVFMKFPFTYNNIFVDTSIVPLFGTAQMRYIDSNFADAYGTLTLPTGTYNNVLRVHTKTVQTITIGGMPFSSGATESYAWYATGFHSPLAMLDVDTVGTGTPYINKARYYTSASGSTGVREDIVTASDLDIYPNPAGNEAQLHFTLKNEAGSSIVVMDMTGKAVMTINDCKAGANTVSINTAALANGNYLVLLRTNEGIATRKLAVTH